MHISIKKTPRWTVKRPCYIFKQQKRLKLEKLVLDLIRARLIVKAVPAWRSQPTEPVWCSVCLSLSQRLNMTLAALNVSGSQWALLELHRPSEGHLNSGNARHTSARCCNLRDKSNRLVQNYSPVNHEDTALYLLTRLTKKKDTTLEVLMFLVGRHLFNIYEACRLSGLCKSHGALQSLRFVVSLTVILPAEWKLTYWSSSISIIYYYFFLIAESLL